VYYNLNKHCLSVLHKTEKGWRLKEHRDSIKLKDVEFIVYEAGRQRVLRDFRKNVHAFVEGIETKTLPKNKKCDATVKYNPYYYNSFIKCFASGAGYAIFAAKCCNINGKIIKVPHEQFI
jgi:hypothetical protein